MTQSTIECAECGRGNRSGARFCAGCGAGLSRRCAACDRELPADAAFCDACGQATAGEAPTRSDPRVYTPRHLAEQILTHRSALEGERKHVTVLFADLSGSTSFSEQRDPEDVHQRMDRFFQALLEEVHRYEGTVNQFLGDGAMALFGAPLALEDAPQRALRSAFGIQRRMPGILDTPGSALRIGIHSGPVVVGRIGDDLRMDYTAVGDTTNLAARLQAMASPGETLLSEATARQVAGFFELDDLGEKAVRGRVQPVRVYRARAERPVAGRVDAVGAEALTPYVGRERDLDTLCAAFDAACAGEGRACFVVGDAGLGKSRLLFELRRRLADQPHFWFEGRCASYGRSTAFQCIVDGLRRAAAIDDRDDDAAAAEKLAACVAAAGGDLEWTLPFFRRLLSLPVSDAAVEALDVVARRSETIRALHAYFERRAQASPLMLVIEDLHWIDPASEEFLGFLLDSVPGSRICAVLTHRPGYAQPFGDRPETVRVALRVLSEAEMAVMASSLLRCEEVPRSLRALIARKAEGNPFFIEELTHSLLEEGVLVRGGAGVVMAREFSEGSIPDSIQDVLMARIDRLGDAPKRAIQVASVIGREFALRLLERITEAGETVHSVVGELRALELIHQKAVHPELAFMFKHALTHDVAYESVLVQRRKALHRIVGTAIEELYRDRLGEHYEALAHHFERAEEWERALHYYELAARKARDAYANHSACEHYQHALAVAERLPDVPAARRRELAEELGAAAFCRSAFRESAEAYMRAAAWCEDERTEALDLARAVPAWTWGHHYEEARTTIAEALERARACGAHEAEAVALAGQDILTIALEAKGGGATPDEPGLEATQAAERSGADEALSIALVEQALWKEMRGEYREALDLAARGCESARRAHATNDLVIGTWGRGLALTCLGRYGAAIDEMQAALEVARRIGQRALESRLLNTLGWAFGEIHCHERASEYNRRGAAVAAEMMELDLVAGIDEIHCNATINLACNHLARGDAGGAEEVLAPILSQIEAGADPWMRWRYSLHALDAQARVALLRGRPERALELAAREAEGAGRHRAPKLEARALELCARALLHLDRRDEAAERLEAALATATRIGYPPAIWRTRSLRAELARRAGDAVTAEREAGQARALVERLARALPGGELRSGLGALAERLVSDPLGAYR